MAAELAHFATVQRVGSRRTVVVRSQRKPAKERKAQKASELADRTADHLVDKSMPVAEQQRRKRALIKGAKKFRDIREDLPKSKEN